MRNRKKLFAGVVVVMLGIGTAAFAYFSTTGDGDGSATVGTDAALVLHGTTSGLLYPGGPSRTVTFTADNPSPGVQYVGTIELVSVDTGVAGCDGTDFTMPDVVANQEVNPGNGQAITATGQLSMANNGDQDECKDAVLTLNLESN